MTWEEIKEVSSNEFATIGNHSHTHDYLIDFAEKKIKDDLKTSINIFKKELGKNSIFFSYPFLLNQQLIVLLKDITI